MPMTLSSVLIAVLHSSLILSLYLNRHLSISSLFNLLIKKIAYLMKKPAEREKELSLESFP